jgi:hypothetical protein
MKNFGNIVMMLIKKWRHFLLQIISSSTFSIELKKKNFLQNLPTNLGYKIFRKRFGN